MKSNIIDDYIKMEEDLLLYTKHIKDFYYWNYIRESLYTSILSNCNNTKEGFSKTKIKFMDIPKQIKNSFTKKYSIRNQKGNYDIIFACHPRRVFINDKYESIYTDEYANSYKNSLTIEYPHEGMHYTPCATRNIYYMDRMYYKRAFFQKLPFGNLNKNEKEQVLETLEILKNSLLDLYEYELNIGELLYKIQFFYRRYLYTKYYLRRVLNKTNPQLIVEVVHYRFENMVLNEVAKERGITTVELQHGLTGKYHIAYNYGRIKFNPVLPEYFLAFSDYWANSMRIPSDLVKIITTGFAYYERKIEQYRPCNNRNIILFLSSGTVGEQLSKVAIALSDMLSNCNYKIVYKLHPGEFADWKKRYPELVTSKKIEVIADTKVELYELFSKSIAQVGVYSTALFEGLGYKIKTYILEMGQIEHVECLLNLKYALLVQNATQIYDDLFNTLKENSIISSEYFWKTDAFKNTRNVIDLLLKEHKN